MCLSHTAMALRQPWWPHPPTPAWPCHRPLQAWTACSCVAGTPCRETVSTRCPRPAAQARGPRSGPSGRGGTTGTSRWIWGKRQDGDQFHQKCKSYLKNPCSRELCDKATNHSGGGTQRRANVLFVGQREEGGAQPGEGQAAAPPPGPGPEGAAIAPGSPCRGRLPPASPLLQPPVLASSHSLIHSFIHSLMHSRPGSPLPLTEGDQSLPSSHCSANPVTGPSTRVRGAQPARRRPGRPAWRRRQLSRGQVAPGMDWEASRQHPGRRGP